MGQSIWSRPLEWEFFRYPLTPAFEEVDFVYRKMLDHGPGLILLMGVTPQYANLANNQYPLEAVDNSAMMIKRVWPGDTEFRNAYLFDWRELEGRADGFEFVIGDGVLTVTKPEDHEVILNAVKSCMNKNALFFIRTFSLPSVKLTLEQVIENATHNISAFKWDLAKSLVNDKFTVNVRNIYSSYMKIKSRLDAKKLGWTAQDLATLEVYKSADQQYTFLPQSEQVSLFDKCGFNVIETFNSTLEGGSDSPLYVLQKK